MSTSGFQHAQAVLSLILDLNMAPSNFECTSKARTKYNRAHRLSSQWINWNHPALVLPIKQYLYGLHIQ